ncbi:glycosyltransferase family 4 protein [Rufibacter latericius]|uniref:Glycosyltransferase family 1 protein n=1 Tax=Rufibacter latericius TaxID=2487040 RepID=A0A3M9MJN2_9BACT|nr:glycosyltransferase family 4 protein [Rufibacter latericius]RNI25751.1 glycosyltransferase family 1 protein [Rufibacter latericius]
MKVIQLLYSGLGGHGSVFFSLMNGLKRFSFSHFAIFYGVEELKVEYKAKCLEGGIPYKYISKKEGLDITSWKSVFNTLVREEPSVVILHSLNLIVVALIARFFCSYKLIAVEHTSNSIKNKSEWLWSLFAMLFADNVVVLTATYEEELKSRLGIVFKYKKTKVINNGIDTDLYSPLVKAKQMDEPFVLTMQARFTSSSKDFETIIQAVAELVKDKNVENNFKVVLAGSGETLAAMKSLVNELEIQDYITFPGMLGEEELVKLLQNTDIYLHSSLAEAMSTAVMQALSVGLPVIATDIPGINNMVMDNQNGLLFSPRNVTKLKELLIFLLSNPSERIRLGNNARAYAQKYLSQTLMADSYKHLF